MLSFKIFTSLLSVRFLQGLAVVNSQYVRPQRNQHLDALVFGEKVNRASPQSDNLNEVTGTYDDYARPLYKYGYSVFDPFTLDVKSQWEHRDGDTVRGAYSMLEADGSMRIVEYRSDKDIGFRAIVKKIPNYLDARRTAPSKFAPTTSPPPRIYRPSSSEAAVRPRDKPRRQYKTSNSPAEFEYTARTSSDAADPSRKYVNEIKGSRFTQNYEQEEKHHEQYDNGGQNILPILISTKR